MFSQGTRSEMDEEGHAGCKVLRHAAKLRKRMSVRMTRMTLHNKRLQKIRFQDYQLPIISHVYPSTPSLPVTPFPLLHYYIQTNIPARSPYLQEFLYPTDYPSVETDSPTLFPLLRQMLIIPGYPRPPGLAAAVGRASLVGWG